MGLFDSIKDAVGGLIGSVNPDQVTGAINQVYPGGLPGLLNKLQQSGYGSQVSSWLGHGPNDPIDGQDLQNVLGSDYVKQLEQHFGIPGDTVADVLAKALPAAVDHHSPNGELAPSAMPDGQQQGS